MYGFNYITTKNSEDIVANWNFFESSEKPVILEIFTPEKENDKVLLNYFKSLK
jgi:2-succinyl-5-enolpyruvyl-6-hydroxy-3-cyclohexene-1-carboxylate synthase